MLLASPPRSRHAPYNRISCTPRSPHSDKSGRSSARSSASVPTLTTSRSSEWLAAYNEAWEDGTGLDINPLTEQHVDYYYVPDKDVQLQSLDQPLTAPTTTQLSPRQRCLTDAFPAEWFADVVRPALDDGATEQITQEINQQLVTERAGGVQRQSEHQHHYHQQQQEEVEDENDSYTGRLVGLAMLGLYCTQGVEEVDCSAAPDVALPPAAATIGSSRPATLPHRTPSSRARSEFNDVNPQLVGQRSSTASSASPSLSATPAHLSSPTLSPMPSSPSIGTPGYAYSPASCSPPNCDTLSPSVPSAAPSPLLPPVVPPTTKLNVVNEVLASTRQQQPQFDESMHQRVSQRLRSRLAVDGNTLSDKRTVASSSSSTSHLPPALCVIDERAHHDRFAVLTNDDGLLRLTAANLPSPQSWLYLGSYLLSTPRVSSLSFHAVCITSAELEMLGHAALSFIRALSFTDNNIGLRPYTLSKLVDLLAACEQLELEHLAITHNSLTSIDALDHIIEQHPMLRSLRLSDNGITNDGARTLASAMKRLAASQHFTDLTTLALDGNRIDARGVDTLMTARDELQRCTGMEVEVTTSDMRQYTPPRFTTSSTAAIAPMSPLALLPLSALAFPMPLTQTAFDVNRVAAVSQTAHKRLTVFKALSLKVRHAQTADKRQVMKTEEDRG